jgi:twitching motility two-component system response regulator PilG
LQLLNQLNYYLHRQGWKDAIEGLKNIPQSELKPTPDSTEDSFKFTNNIYERAITWLRAQKYLDNSQVLQLIEDLTQDALESCLWLSQAQFSWHEEETPAWLQANRENTLSLDLADIVNFLQHRLKQWQNCASEISSPHQRPYFLNYRDIEKASASKSLSHKVLQNLAQIMRRGLSFRQLSMFLDRDELHVAQILSPYIENKTIHLRSPQPPLHLLPTMPRSPVEGEEKEVVNASQAVKTFKIVCIDDSPTILSEIKRFLKDMPFEITAIDDPVQASAVIFRLEPDIILLDITMPRINGYKLCSLLRSSQAFEKTPIIMVTGNTSLIDKAKAKIAGASDYLTKPFTKEGLMKIITKYLT